MRNFIFLKFDILFLVEFQGTSTTLDTTRGGGSGPRSLIGGTVGGGIMTASSTLTLYQSQRVT